MADKRGRAVPGSPDAAFAGAGTEGPQPSPLNKLSRLALANAASAAKRAANRAAAAEAFAEQDAALPGPGVASAGTRPLCPRLKVFRAYAQTFVLLQRHPPMTQRP